jgi:hypothetical protein
MFTQVCEGAEWSGVKCDFYDQKLKDINYDNGCPVSKVHYQAKFKD